MANISVQAWARITYLTWKKVYIHYSELPSAQIFELRLWLNQWTLARLVKKTLHTTITMAYKWQNFRDSSTFQPRAHVILVIAGLNYTQIITIACCPHSRLQVGLSNPSEYLAC